MAPRVALTLLVFLAAVGIGFFEASMLVLQRLEHGSERKLRPRSALRSTLSAAYALPVVNNARRRVVGKRRAEALRSCMPDALRLLSSALSSGSSLVQALEYAARHCDEPLRGELEQAVWDLGAGKGFSQAMEGLRARTGGSGFAYLAVAMEIQHVSGGSLHATIASVSDALRQTAELEEELKVKTAQGRLSARIVSVTPVILLAVLSVFSHDYVGMFFSSAAGVFLLVLALLLECLGVVAVRRTLAIDVAGQIGEA